MSSFDDFLETLWGEIKNQAEAEGISFLENFLADARESISQMEESLALYTKQLSVGLITPADFEELVQDQVNLAKMAALTQQGLAKIKLDHYKRLVTDAILKAAAKVF